ncbi:MAG: hypothetical protein R3B52_00740 [Candidatus Paceibacterota bacterium]
MQKEKKELVVQRVEAFIRRLRRRLIPEAYLLDSEGEPLELKLKAVKRAQRRLIRYLRKAAKRYPGFPLPTYAEVARGEQIDVEWHRNGKIMMLMVVRDKGPIKFSGKRVGADIEQRPGEERELRAIAWLAENANA